MEGLTPISALIHAATMVTAGIFMVARMPLFEYSEAALSFVLVIGAITAFFMGLLGVINNKISDARHRRLLGALGLATPESGGAGRVGVRRGDLSSHDTRLFKALLFLAAGSVVIGMHHEQDLCERWAVSTKYIRIHGDLPAGSARWRCSWDALLRRLWFKLTRSSRRWGSRTRWALWALPYWVRRSAA